MAPSAVTTPASVAHGEAKTAAQEYLRQRLTTKSNASSIPFTVPVIDIGNTFSSSLADKQVVAAQIHNACTNSGYILLYCQQYPPSRN